MVFRAFGAADAVETGRALRRACDARSLRLLVGVNERLALAVDADGLHLPEWAVSRLPALRRRRPRWLLTAAAHSLTAARRAATAGADGVVVSAVFPSESPSAGRPIGPLRLAGIARATPAPVIALGGVNGRSVRRLLSTGVAGVAAVGALA